MKKSLLVLYISPGNKWFHTLSQGLVSFGCMFISLMLLVQFYQFTLLKLVAWLLPIVGLAFVLSALWKQERWKYRRGAMLFRFLPQASERELRLFGLLVPAFWLLIWLLLWRGIRWLGVWQYIGGEMLIRAVSAFKAPAGYYELGSGAWLGSSPGKGPSAEG